MRALPFAFIPLASAICYGQTPLTATDILRLAAQNRPILASARRNIDAARAQTRAASAYYPLQLGLGGSSRGEIGATDQDLILSQAVDLYGKIGRHRAIAEAGVRRAEAETKQVALEVQTDVLTMFAEAVAAQARRRVAGDLLKIAESVYSTTKKRLDLGSVAELQLTRASIELGRAKQVVSERQVETTAALTRLSGLVGPNTDISSVSEGFDIMPVNPGLVAGRPDLKLIEAERAVATATARAARQSRRPDLEFQLVRSPWSTGSSTFVARIQLSWAVDDHGKAGHEARAADLQADSATRQFEDVSYRAAQELVAIEAEILANRARIENYQVILNSSHDLVTRLQKGFAEGFGTQIEILEASRALREIELEMIDTKQRYALSVIAQVRASGVVLEVSK